MLKEKISTYISHVHIHVYYKKRQGSGLGSFSIATRLHMHAIIRDIDHSTKSELPALSQDVWK